MVVELEDADDNALMYLAWILQYPARCGLAFINVQVKNGWQGTIQAWHALDEVLFKLRRGRVFLLLLQVHKDAPVPTWDTLPYPCMDNFWEEMLPKSRRRVLAQCHMESCRLHDEERWCRRAQRD